MDLEHGALVVALILAIGVLVAGIIMPNVVIIILALISIVGAVVVLLANRFCIIIHYVLCRIGFHLVDTESPHWAEGRWWSQCLYCRRDIPW